MRIQKLIFLKVSPLTYTRKVFLNLSRQASASLKTTIPSFSLPSIQPVEKTAVGLFIAVCLKVVCHFPRLWLFQCFFSFSFWLFNQELLRNGLTYIYPPWDSKRCLNLRVGIIYQRWKILVNSSSNIANDFPSVFYDSNYIPLQIFYLFSGNNFHLFVH